LVVRSRPFDSVRGTRDAGLRSRRAGAPPEDRDRSFDVSLFRGTARRLRFLADVSRPRRRTGARRPGHRGRNHPSQRHCPARRRPRTPTTHHFPAVQGERRTRGTTAR
jgi:hypothetical protein